MARFFGMTKALKIAKHGVEDSLQISDARPTQCQAQLLISTRTQTQLNRVRLIHLKGRHRINNLADSRLCKSSLQVVSTILLTTVTTGRMANGHQTLLVPQTNGHPSASNLACAANQPGKTFTCAYCDLYVIPPAIAR